MALERKSGDVQPGIRWGMFTIRIPFIHTRFCLPEFLQGLAVAAATGAALVPVLTAYFGLTFEEAIAFSMIQSILLSTSWMLFGEPYSPGWITPALPFALVFVLGGSFDDPTARFQAMAALSIDFAILLLVLGVTGLGGRLVKIVPDVLKGGIILGAALAAFLQIFDFAAEDNVFVTQTYAAVTALVISLLLAFSVPLQKMAQTNSLARVLISLGLLPGFVIAGLVGYFTGEIVYDIEWGILLLPLGDLWSKASPFAIGWPDFSLYLQCLPLALITYVILFGDLVTGEEIYKAAEPARPDEKIERDNTRSHISIGIRNVIMAITAPFFPTQGALWAGVHVVVVQRWAKGREEMDSVFDGISSYYVFNFPILFMFLPLITLLKPLLGIALMMTLALTGFACAGVAMDKAKDAVERGVMLLTAISLCLFEPWQGLLIGVLATVLIVGVNRSEKNAVAD